MQTKYNEATAKLAKLEAELEVLTAACEDACAWTSRLDRTAKKQEAEAAVLTKDLVTMQQAYHTDSAAVALGDLPEGGHLHYREDISSAKSAIEECGHAVGVILDMVAQYRNAILLPARCDEGQKRLTVKAETAYLELLDRIKPMTAIDRRCLRDKELFEGKHKLEWYRFDHERSLNGIQPW